MNDAIDWWAVAGGWAIDLWLGAESRPHHDVEVVVRRCDQRKVHRALVTTSTMWCLDPPGSGWRPWSGEPIEPPSFQLQARSPWGEFDLFAETVDRTTWTFRRDERITRPIEHVITQSTTGIPIVRPEIQLLYMAASTEPKNQHDFETARPYLEPDDTRWLRDSLAIAHPEHRWLDSLR